MRKYLFVCFLSGVMPAIFSAHLMAQTSFGPEFQLYPTGIMPGVRMEFGLTGHDAINLRVGANLFDHRSMGVHDSEKGMGFGGTLGYRHYVKDLLNGFFVGGRMDVWRNKVNWEDYQQMRSGTTRIVVLQPTAELGYMFLSDRLSNRWKWGLAPALGLGYEINAVSDGADVGEGAIILLGVSVVYRW